MKFLIASKKIKPFIPTDLIQLKLEIALKSDLISNQLKDMKFDPRFTKPANFNGLDLAVKIFELKDPVIIDRYIQNYFKWKIAPVNAYTEISKPNWIFFNERNLKRDSIGPDSLEETLWHELVHIADSHSAEVFNHGENKLKGKEESAPVKFARYMSSFTIGGTNA
jgi:hypothetical protein